MATPKSHPQLIETAERRAFILDKRRSGMIFKDIVQACVEEFGVDKLPKGFDERYAYKDVMREMDKLRADMAEDVDTIRRMEIDRLDIMLSGIWEQAKRGETSSIDRALKIMSRRSKLMGLDAPQRYEGELKGEMKVIGLGIDVDDV